MNFILNLPFICILLTLFSGPISLLFRRKTAKRINLFIIIATGIMSAVVFGYTAYTKETYVYRMGHFSAPWGNEIRFGVLEAGLALFFCFIMLLSMLGGIKEREEELEHGKQNLYYIMVNLLLTSLLALVYTNDLFTAYVFVEINTIAACGLIMIRQSGRTLVASTRYLVMSLLGSGMLLLGICFLYTLTGNLLMSNIQEQVKLMNANGTYHTQLIIAIALMSVGLAVKSALFPFHTWLPDAYGYSTVSSAAMLSSLVSKGYIFLIIKIFYRVISLYVVQESHVLNVFFVFGIAAMIVGSLDAIQEHDILRMIAYSSVAQVGYIYMGLGLGTDLGTVASIYHILSHAATKSLLFVSANSLIQVSGDSKSYDDLTGAGYRNKLAGIAFTVGSVSMVGVPMFSGFMSKVLFAQAAIGHSVKMLPTMIALAISTLLNAIYFMKTVIRIYTPSTIKEELRDLPKGSPLVHQNDESVPNTEMLASKEPLKSVVFLCFIALNLFLGMFSDPIIDMIKTGLSLFS